MVCGYFQRITFLSFLFFPLPLPCFVCFQSELKRVVQCIEQPPHSFFNDPLIIPI